MPSGSGVRIAVGNGTLVEVGVLVAGGGLRAVAWVWRFGKVMGGAACDS
jgi:hypothetical protein